MTTTDRVIIYALLFSVVGILFLEGYDRKHVNKAILDQTKLSQIQIDDLRTYYRKQQDYLQVKLDSVHRVIQGQDSVLKQLQIEKKSLILKMR